MQAQRPLKLVQINRADVTGGRFNGYNMRHLLAARGVDSTHLVWDKTVDDPRVRQMFPFPGSRLLNRSLSKIERETSRHAVLQAQSFALPLHREFAEADVAHYHIIHDGYFSILALPWLARLKPSVWTWHDPWIMTGHCVYPLGCERWRTGCGSCPDLSLFFAMKEDKTARAFRTKRKVVRNADIDIILASQWMMNMARNSPIAEGARLHHIPFGLDLEHHKERDRLAARRRFGIEDDRIVIALRAISSTFKGLEHFVAALDALQTKKPICVLTVQEGGYFNHHLGRHQIIELGWVRDDDTMIDALSAADIFAMPSTAEAFGLMAIEAMACGKPVIVFEGTSLPEVTFAPEAGIAVPMRDDKALSVALDRLIENDAERLARGRRSRELAEIHYSADLYLSRLVKLYGDVARRKRAHAGISYEAPAAH